TGGWETPMRVVSDRARVVPLSGGVVALVAGAAGRAFVIESLVALAPVNAVAEALKWSVGRVRPDGDRGRRNSSFPSSPAANAFGGGRGVQAPWAAPRDPGGARGAPGGLLAAVSGPPLVLRRGVRAAAGRGRGRARGLGHRPAPAGNRGARSGLAPRLRASH